ncbi:family 43 glycosylhydrolase [Mucilaginibacter sp.]|uniref:family 43 glycosylhydrolase n=1 Tax=Mucilaginibacter sp. TaxID=1882438 RepID=UPI003262ED6C
MSLQRCVLLPVILFTFFIAIKASGQNQALAAGNGNPIIPGYFADPTIKKFGDTFYLYATTDGNGGGLGPSQVWTSKDFVNWTMQDMNWPTTHNYWAPDATLGNDGKYYLYYCQPTVEIYGASASTPIGPWTPLYADNKPVLTNLYVPGVITLDGQTFRDDDGKFYMVWGTWGIYPGYGCGVGLLNPDMKTFAKTAKIPNTDAKDFFEGAFMFKRKGIYYLMYSSGFCENETYRVQYATSKTGPMDGYVYGKNSPILTTNADGTVHGPGHNSVLRVGDDYYIVYHRHNNPHSGGGYHRQISADKLVFDADGNIEKVIPTHTGIGLLAKTTNPYPNLAYQKKVTASSFYNDDYKPQFAADDNNGTLWKPKNNSTAPAWLQVDLGAVTTVKKVLTQFEYATWYYQYFIEYSINGKDWQIFADKRNSRWHGSPAIDEKEVKARYIRLTITGTGYPGLYKAVWNLKVFGGGDHEVVPANINPPAERPKFTQQGLVVDVDAESLQPGTIIKQWANKGSLGGSFKTDGKSPYVDFVAGKKTVIFKAGQTLSSNFKVPPSLAGNNSYTVCFWAYTGEVKKENPVLDWGGGGDDLSGAAFGYGSNPDMGAALHRGWADLPYKKDADLAGKWHYVAISFDGTFENVYIDGRLNNQENKMLFVKPAAKFLIGGQHEGPARFSGAIASLQVYDRALSHAGIKAIFNRAAQPDVAIYFDAAKLPYGQLKSWDNDGDEKTRFVPTGTPPEVKDAAGRIAVFIDPKHSLVLDKRFSIGNNYSVAAMVYSSTAQQDVFVSGFKPTQIKNSDGLKFNAGAGKWHLLIKTFKGNVVSDYLDGRLTGTKRQAVTAQTKGAFTLGAEDLYGFTGSVASLGVYKHALTGTEIGALVATWRQNMHPPAGATLVYKKLPHALSPKMIALEAGSADQSADLQYYFSGGEESTPRNWTDNPYYINYGLSPDKTYEYTYKVKDYFGNVAGPSALATTSTDLSQFAIAADAFSTNKDFTNGDVTGTIWDAMMGKGAAITKVEAIANDHTLRMSSVGTNWDGNLPYGPFLYKKVEGDFVAEVEISDVTGLEEKKVVGNHEAGLMVRLAGEGVGDNQHEQLLQNGVFPAWSVGNMLTNLVDGDRRQTNNQSSWNFDRYVQIQRSGDLFYLRTSKDNTNWTDLPGSPVLRADMNKKAVQVGLYQCTYGPRPGFGYFRNFKLVSIK